MQHILSLSYGKDSLACLGDADGTLRVWGGIAVDGSIQNSV